MRKGTTGVVVEDDEDEEELDRICEQEGLGIPRVVQITVRITAAPKRSKRQSFLDFMVYSRLLAGHEYFRMLEDFDIFNTQEELHVNNVNNFSDFEMTSYSCFEQNDANCLQKQPNV